MIGQYRDGYRVVVEALAGISDQELDRSDGDEWTPPQIAHHLADSEMSFAEKLTSDRPIAPSLEAMRWARETCSQLLDRMSEADWRIVGTHTESGPYGTEDWLRIYAAHAHDHAQQIERARGKK